MAKTTITFSLDIENDRDLLHWLDSLPRRGRSGAIRDALRLGLGRGVTLGDVYQAVKSLERKIGRGVVLAGPCEGPAEVEEPPDIAAALDSLGL